MVVTDEVHYGETSFFNFVHHLANECGQWLSI